MHRKVLSRIDEEACDSQQIARRSSTHDQRLLSANETWRLALSVLNVQFPALDGLVRDSEVKTGSRSPSRNYICARHPWIATCPTSRAQEDASIATEGLTVAGVSGPDEEAQRILWSFASMPSVTVSAHSKSMLQHSHAPDVPQSLGLHLFPKSSTGSYARFDSRSRRPPQRRD